MSARTQGVLLGALGVLVFSFTLPATRVAVDDLDPTFVGLGRVVVAAAVAGLLLAARREALPPPAIRRRLGIVAVGVVFGFPLFSALALANLSSAHGAVIVGLLPAATAVMAVLRAGERPSPAFWAASAAGLVAVLAFAASQGAGLLNTADVLILIAVALAAIGYAEGGALAREIGGWRVICWALVLFGPLVMPAVAVAIAQDGLSAGPVEWLCFAYVALFSQLFGFFAWYRGLALGGVAQIGQIQLAQPLLTFVWSAALLGERIGLATLAAAVFVLASVAVTQRTRVYRDDASAASPQTAPERRLADSPGC